MYICKDSSNGLPAMRREFVRDHTQRFESPWHFCGRNEALLDYADLQDVHGRIDAWTHDGWFTALQGLRSRGDSQLLIPIFSSP
jgi:hypothetical protein